MNEGAFLPYSVRLISPGRTTAQPVTTREGLWLTLYVVYRHNGNSADSGGDAV